MGGENGGGQDPLCVTTKIFLLWQTLCWFVLSTTAVRKMFTLATCSFGTRKGARLWCALFLLLGAGPRSGEGPRAGAFVGHERTYHRWKHTRGLSIPSSGLGAETGSCLAVFVQTFVRPVLGSYNRALELWGAGSKDGRRKTKGALFTGRWVQGSVMSRRRSAKLWSTEYIQLTLIFLSDRS